MLGKKFKQSSVGMLLLKVGNAGLGFLVSLVLARTLNQEEYGMYVYALAWATFLIVPAVMGFDNLLVRNIASYMAAKEWQRMKGLVKRSLQIVGAVSFSIAIVTALIASLLTFNRWDTQFFTLCIALILVPVTATLVLRRSTMQGLHHVVKGYVGEAVLQPLVLLLSIFILGLLFNVSISAPLAMSLNVSGALVALAVSNYFYRCCIPAPAEHVSPRYETKIWVRNALHLVLLSGIYVINAQTDVLMLGSIVGAREAGIYHVANKLAGLVVLVLMAVNAVFSPTISHLYSQGNHDKLQQLVTKTARVITLFAIPSALVLIIFDGWFLSLFGPEFSAGQQALKILVLSQIVNALMGSVGFLLIMTGHERDATIGIGVSFLVNVILNVILIPGYGVEGAAIATAVSIVVWNGLLGVMVWARLKIVPTALGRLGR